MKTILHLSFLALALTLAGGCDSTPTEDGAGGGTTGSENAPDLGEDFTQVQQLRGMEAQQTEGQAEYIELRRQVEAATGEDLGGMELTEEQEARLRSILAADESSPQRGVIQALLDQQDQLDELERQIEDLRGRLPQPQIIQRGDSHLQLAMRWLQDEHGLSAEEAEDAAGRSLLTDRLLPGYEVWHFYSDGVYASAVTQGSARVSPYFLNLRAERAIESERDEAIGRADTLQAELLVLEETRDRLVADLDLLQTRYDQLETDHVEVSGERDTLLVEVSSTRYGIDTRVDLLQSQTIGPGGRLLDFDEDTFTATLDLREADTITIRAGDYGLRRVNRVQVRPRAQFLEGDHWRTEISEDGSTVRFLIVDPERFGGEQFLIMLQGVRAI